MVSCFCSQLPKFEKKEHRMACVFRKTANEKKNIFRFFDETMLLLLFWLVYVQILAQFVFLILHLKWYEVSLPKLIAIVGKKEKGQLMDGTEVARLLSLA